ncbi:Cro/CI family transcriptional regulator [Pseudomonas sp. YH-1]|uniref:Cro/CI family transcriptional regulator n=1 Tax=Pseudomonas sp. YH-1 TaxID=3384787 RepID=UPI003F7E6520
MTGQTLSAFVDRYGQEGAAKALGLSQAAISKALKAQRIILIIQSQGGGFEAAELKRFPSGGGRSCLAPDPMAFMPSHFASNSSGEHGEIVELPGLPAQSDNDAVQTSSTGAPA